MSREAPGEALRIPHGRQVSITHVRSHSPSGETTTRAIPLPPLGRQQTEAPLNTFPFQPSPAPPFQADQHWIFAGVCDGTNALLRAYCSHVASAPFPSHRAPHRVCPNHKSTREAQFCSRPSQKPLTGACRACGSISKSVRRFTVQLYHE